jgi:6-phosphogluconate dehydrogenase
MQVEFIGLGKMGLNLALQAWDKGHEVITYDVSEEARKQARNSGLIVVDTLEELLTKKNTPRLCWLMVPAGPVIDRLLEAIVPLLSSGDIIIDGGNSNYRDSMRRAYSLKLKGIGFLDCGTSGGVEGARKGVCAMVGGEEENYRYASPLLTDITLAGGLLHCGPAGSGHYVKMVHNGIEYGMMQSLAEGMQMIENSGFNLDSSKVGELWMNGSVIRGWLLELTVGILKSPEIMNSITGVVKASGEAEWMVADALEKKIPVPVITQALFERYKTQGTSQYQGKLLSALRNAFGGHAMQKETN